MHVHNSPRLVFKPGRFWQLEQALMHSCTRSWVSCSQPSSRHHTCIYIHTLCGHILNKRCNTVVIFLDNLIFSRKMVQIHYINLLNGSTLASTQSYTIQKASDCIMLAVSSSLVRCVIIHVVIWHTKHYVHSSYIQAFCDLLIWKFGQKKTIIDTIFENAHKRISFSNTCICVHVVLSESHNVFIWSLHKPWSSVCVRLLKCWLTGLG